MNTLYKGDSDDDDDDNNNNNNNNITEIGLTPGGSSTVHIYTSTVHRIHRTEHT
jgi:hypothetical protein